MAAESPKEKSGGISYDLILKPASADTPTKPSPPKERPVSQEYISRKLKDAEERRQSMEALKLKPVIKTKARIQEAQAKVQDIQADEKRKVEKKITEKMRLFEENRNAQIQSLQDKLREHANRVEDVRKAHDTYRTKLKERIDQKLEVSTEKRESQMRAIQERLREHEKHVSEVLETSNKFSKQTEEKMLLKMETSLKNREDQLKQLMQRLSDHERHIQEVRKNKEVVQS